MPFYALTFNRRIDYENGPSDTRFIKIIKCAEPDRQHAEDRLRAELMLFINMWNDYHAGKPWEDTQAQLDAAKKERVALIKTHKEDEDFIPTEFQPDFHTDHANALAALQAVIDGHEATLKTQKERARRELRRGKDYAEWNKIPDFGTLSFMDLLGDITFNDRHKISMPSFKVIEADEALALLADRSPMHF